MQLSLKTILINGEDPDPKEWPIGFGEWPQPIDSVPTGLNWIYDIFTTTLPPFEDYSITIQAPPDDVSVYINVSATFVQGETEYVIEELWEITADV